MCSGPWRQSENQTEVISVPKELIFKCHLQTVLHHTAPCKAALNKEGNEGSVVQTVVPDTHFTLWEQASISTRVVPTGPGKYGWQDSRQDAMSSLSRTDSKRPGVDRSWFWDRGFPGLPTCSRSASLSPSPLHVVQKELHQPRMRCCARTPEDTGELKCSHVLVHLWLVLFSHQFI